MKGRKHEVNKCKQKVNSLIKSKTVRGVFGRQEIRYIDTSEVGIKMWGMIDFLLGKNELKNVQLL
jgi:hypothetical protein